MAVLKIQEKKRGGLAMPHYILLNGRLLCVMKGDAVSATLPEGQYVVTVRSAFRFIESSVKANVHDATENIVKFGDRERIWDAIFWIDMILWAVKRIVNVPPPWGTVYEIVSNGFFAVWLVSVWMIGKKYFLIESYSRVVKEQKQS